MKNKKAIFLGGMLFLSCINFVYIAWFLVHNGYLPPPFVFDKENTFMDFYNTLYWSGQEGIYSVWNSVYPPLNFLLLRIFQFLFFEDISKLRDGFEIRGIANIFPLIIINIISLLISIKISYKKIGNLKIKLVIFIILLISPAFLFAIERGNLIIISIPVLSWYIFSNNQITRSLGLAILINLKPYFVIFYIVQLINVKGHEENKDFLFLAPVLALIIFLVTGLLLNQEFYLIPMNLFGFATNSALLSPTEVLSFPSSVAAFAYFRELVSEFSIPPIIGHLFRLIVFFYLIKSLIIIYKYNVKNEDLEIFTIIFITNYSISTGGYGVLYFIPALALLYKQKNYFILVLIVASMYLGVWDIVPIHKYDGVNMISYFSGGAVNVESYVSLGAIVRPIANFIVLVLFFKNIEKRFLHEKFSN